MTISRLTVDKLGVKLYDRVSAVIAELVANSYDADATEDEVVAPMTELLATKIGGKLKDKGYAIEVRDNGAGMTPQEVNDFYLVVGAERRNDPKRGDRSPCGCWRASAARAGASRRTSSACATCSGPYGWRG